MPLSSIKGTGPEGRIVKADVEEFLGIIIFWLFPFLTIFSVSFLPLFSAFKPSLCPNTSSYGTASGGKKTTAKTSKLMDSKVPAMDYVDIPHTQIRKANTDTTLYLDCLWYF